MTITNLTNAQVWPGKGGFASRMGASPSVATQATISATGHYSAMVLQAERDMVITHVGGRNGAATGSPSVSIRIELPPTAATGVPSGTLWATNTSATISPTNNGWSTPVALTAAATITRGQVFVVKWLWLNGSIVVQRFSGPNGNGMNYPYGYDSAGTPAKSPQAQRPWFLGSDATTPYLVNGLWPVTTVANTTFNNASAAGARRGLLCTMPFPGRAIGLVFGSIATTVGDFKATLYNNAGTLLSTSPTMEGDVLATTATGPVMCFFTSYTDFATGDVLRLIQEPTSTTNTQQSTLTLGSGGTNLNSYRNGWPHGTGVNHTTWTSGGGWVDTATGVLADVDLIYIPDDGTASAAGGGSVFGAQGGVIQ